MKTEREARVQPHDPDPSHYLWGSVPLPVLHSNLSPGEKVVYIAYFSATRVHRLRYRSVSQVSRDLGMSRSTVKAAMKTLEERGFIRREYARTSSGLEVVRVFLFVPEEVGDAGRWLQATPEGAEEDEKKGARRVAEIRPPLAERRPPHGRNPATIEKEKREEEGENKRCGGAASDPDPEEDGEETNLDSGSREAAERIAREKEERAARKAERAERRAAGRSKLPPESSGEDLRETPSLRPEWTAWRERDPSAWRARDLVGYWVCRFRETRGAEDPDFRVPSLSSPYAARAMKLCREYVRQHLDGSNHRFREAVERILATAEERGRPVSLLYFLTPSNPRTLASLDTDKRTGRNSPASPAEINDAWGGDREHWDRRAEELAEKRRRKAAKLGVPLSEVRIHVGEEV